LGKETKVKFTGKLNKEPKNNEKLLTNKDRSVPGKKAKDLTASTCSRKEE
jgi:hypothetical protein